MSPDEYGGSASPSKPRHGGPGLCLLLHFPGRGSALSRELSVPPFLLKKLWRFIAEVKARCRQESPVVFLVLKLS